jgi:hypothetical protein
MSLNPAGMKKDDDDDGQPIKYRVSTSNNPGCSHKDLSKELSVENYSVVSEYDVSDQVIILLLEKLISIGQSVKYLNRSVCKVLVEGFDSKPISISYSFAYVSGKLGPEIIYYLRGSTGQHRYASFSDNLIITDGYHRIGNNNGGSLAGSEYRLIEKK